MNNMCDEAVTHTEEKAAQRNIKTFKKRLNVETSYFNQAKPSLYSLFLKIK